MADAIDAFARTRWMDSSGEPHAGVITAHDLAGWSAGYETPATLDFAGLTVAKTGAWGQGPVLLQQLALLDGVDLAFGTADFLHTVVEGAKLAFADRDAHYGDTDDVPLAALLSSEYTAGRRSLIGGRASTDLRPGSPDGRVPRLPRGRGRRTPVLANPPSPGTASRARRTRSRVRPVSPAATPATSMSWTARGTMVAATPSGGWLQSSPVIPALGFPLGTRLQMTTLEPGLPTTLTPGKRPRTTLSPTLVARATMW